MVKNNKDYNPTPVYNRRMVRTIMRHTAIRFGGYHNVSKRMHNSFDINHKHIEPNA